MYSLIKARAIDISMGVTNTSVVMKEPTDTVSSLIIPVIIMQLIWHPCSIGFAVLWPLRYRLLAAVT